MGAGVGMVASDLWEVEKVWRGREGNVYEDGVGLGVTGRGGAAGFDMEMRCMRI